MLRRIARQSIDHELAITKHSLKGRKIDKENNTKLIMNENGSSIQEREKGERESDLSPKAEEYTSGEKEECSPFERIFQFSL